MKPLRAQMQTAAASESRRAAYARPRVLWTGATVLMLVSLWWASAQTSKKPSAGKTPTKSAPATTGSAASQHGPVSLRDLPQFVREYGRQRALATKIGVAPTFKSGLSKMRFPLTERDLTPNSPSDEREPFYSPSGDIIAFASTGADINTDGRIDSVNVNGRYHIWVMNRDGSQQRQITGLATGNLSDGSPDPTKDANRDQRQPSFSPDGNAIVYTDQGTFDALNTVKPDPTSKVELSITRPFETDPATRRPPVTRITFSGGNKKRPVYSPNGLQIAFASNVFPERRDINGNFDPSGIFQPLGQFDIFTIPPSGAEASVLRLTGGTNDLAGDTADDLNPVYSIVSTSPQRIFFSSNRLNNSGNTARRIWRMNGDATGTGKIQITDPTQRRGPGGGIVGTATDEDDYPSPSRQQGFPSGGSFVSFTERLAFQSNSLTDDRPSSGGALDTVRDLNIWSLSRNPSSTPTTPLENAANSAVLESNATSSPRSFEDSQLKGANATEDTAADQEPAFSRSVASGLTISQLAFASERRAEIRPSGDPANTTPRVVNPTGGPNSNDIWITVSQDFTPPRLIPISVGNQLFPVVAPGPQSPFRAPRTPEQGLATGEAVKIAFVIEEQESGLNSVTVNLIDAEESGYNFRPSPAGGNSDPKIGPTGFGTNPQTVNDDLTVEVNWEIKPTVVASIPLTFVDNGPVSAGGQERQTGAIAGDGVYYCEGTFGTAQGLEAGRDYYFDIRVKDNSPAFVFDPVSETFDAGNLFTFDHIWGFTTRPFAKSTETSDLFVSDYTVGQRFPGALRDSRFRRMDPVESYFLNNPATIIPKDGQGIGNLPIPRTLQNVDTWRILSRGELPLEIFDTYSPRTAQQIDPVAGASDNPPFSNRTRNVAVAKNGIFWATPYTGLVFSGPGTLADAETQRRLTNFLDRGGRLAVTGRDVVFALSNNGSSPSNFLRNELQADFAGEAPGDAVNTIDGIFGTFQNPGRFTRYESTFPPFNNAAFNDPQIPPRPNPFAPEFKPNQFSDAAVNNGGLGFSDSDRTVNSPNFGRGTTSIDFIGAGGGGPGTTVTPAYTLAGQTVGQRIERVRQSGPTPGVVSRVAFLSFGLEAVNRRYLIDNNTIHCINVRRGIATGIKDFYLKTSGISGQVINDLTNQPVANFLVEVRSSNTGARSFARTDQNGNYEILGLPFEGFDFGPALTFGVYSVRDARTAAGAPVGVLPNARFAPTNGSGAALFSTNTVTNVNLRVIPLAPGSVSGVANQSNGTFNVPPFRADDSPLPNVPVLLKSVQTFGRNEIPEVPNGGKYAALTSTDAAGRFSFANVPPNIEYTVIFNPNDRAESQGGDIPDNSGINYGAFVSSPNTVANLRPDPTIGRRQIPDAARDTRIIVPVGNPFILNDTDTDNDGRSDVVDDPGTVNSALPILVPIGPTVSGQVFLNNTSTPANNATVSLLDAGGNVVRTTSTIANGNYAFFDVRPGTYSVRASADNAGVVIGPVTSPDSPFTVVQGTDFTVKPIILLRQNLSGTVQFNGAPAAGATVELLDSNGAPLMPSPRIVTTTATGAYSFTNVTPGTYIIRATLTNGLRQDKALTVVAGNDYVVNFTFFARSISGRVTLNGTPVQGATVELRQNNAVVQTTTTDVNGDYSFGLVAVGTYTVRAAFGADSAESPPFDVVGTGGSDIVNVNLDLFLQSVSGTVRLNGQPLAGIRVELVQNDVVVQSTLTATDGTYTFNNVNSGTFLVRASSNGDTAQVTITVIRGNSLTKVDLDLRLQTLSGRVTLNGQPRPGARVELFQGGKRLQIVTADSAGLFSFANVGTGVFVLRTSALGDTVEVTVDVVRGTDITGIELRLLLQRVSGRVLLNGAPIGGATVQLIRNGTVFSSTSTNSQGRYTFTNIAAGLYGVRANRFGDTAQINVTVVRGKNLDAPDINLLLQQVTGRVTLNGVPVSGAIVQLIKNGSSIRRATTDVKGVYLLTGIAAGPYTVRANKSGDQVQRAITVKRGFNLRGIDLDLRLQNVTGRVTVNGVGLAGVTVELLQGTRVLQNTQTAANGLYIFRGLAAGDYIVRATRAGDVVQVLVRVSRVSGVQAPELHLKVATLRGRVTLDGRGASGVVVQLIRDGAAIRRTTTNSNGNYSFGEVVVGRYSVRATTTVGGKTLMVERGFVIERGEAEIAPDLVLRSPSPVPTPTPDPVADEFQPGQTYQISIPYADSSDPGSTTTVEKAFTVPPLAADNTENYRIFRYDPVNLTYVQLSNRATIRRGEGYFLQPLARGVSIRRPAKDVTRKPTNALTFEIVLRRNPSQPANDRTNGYNLIGFPFDPALVSSIDWLKSEVIAPDGRRFTTLDQAVAAGIVDDTLFTFDQSTNDYTPVSNTIEPFKGYYARTFVDGVRIILKANR